jgi:hypothetical protein
MQAVVEHPLQMLALVEHTMHLTALEHVPVMVAPLDSP